MWYLVAHYTGTDIAVLRLDLASKMVNDLDINDKVTLLNLDAVALHQLTGTYDLIMTTWFTAGNFYPDDFDFKSYSRAISKLDLTVNSKFTLFFLRLMVC